MENQQQSPQTVIVVSQQKSVGLAFILTFLFGPLGLLYASVTGGIIIIILGALIGIITVGIGLIVAWIVSIVWAIVAVNKHNASLTTNPQGKK